MEFQTAHEIVTKLVDTFAASHDKYLASDYNESAARKDFIDKFFIALGWDVNHDYQTNPYEQEVKVERNVAVAARVKKADYAFFVGPNFAQERFFVEAKRPSAFLDTPDNCFQTIRYAFSSAKAALSILTNFNELYIIDCRYRPDITTAQNHVHKKYHFEDFRDRAKFGEIFYLFGREFVADGSLEKYAEQLPKPKGKVKQRRLFGDNYQEIDEAFLSKLEEYRKDLAKMFKRKNQHLTSDDLTEAVQRTLDRLVFIRFLEDKLIEPSTILDKFGEKPHAWKQFIAKCREFDKSYNGIIFKENPLLDSASFEVDDSVFLKVCDDFADKYSPYHFNYIPIHILGSIYERFLGNVIVATAKRATIEPKPEVRKAGGVFYTPQYIVNYIVENTVGALLQSSPPYEGGVSAASADGVVLSSPPKKPAKAGTQNVTPADVAKMRFADIACGSGSFLLGVYDYLLRWHTKYYNTGKGKKEAKKDGCITNDDGTFALSFEQKREILVNNIYGVDIDRQAYEVTQLSLFLKLLDEETQGTSRQFLTGHRESLLPSLNQNIVCGNALVDWDISSGDLFEQLDQEKERKLNPMSFEQKFPKIMADGGFDAIVGNPPWGADFTETELEYFRVHHVEIIVRMIDSFMYFVRQALTKIRPLGYFGMIIPDVVLYQLDNEKLRGLLLANTNLKRLINTGDVFVKVTRPTAIIIFENAKPIEGSKHRIKIADLSSIARKEKEKVFTLGLAYEEISQNALLAINGLTFVTSGYEKYVVLNKIFAQKVVDLVNLVDSDGIQRGVSPDLKKAFIVDTPTIVECELEHTNIVKVLTGGKQVKRFQVLKNDLNLIYTSNSDDFSRLPNICEYIAQFKSEITCKEVAQKKHSIYALHRARDKNIFTKPEKILGVITEDEIIVTIDNSGTFVTDGLYLFAPTVGINAKFLVGILNTKLFVFIYRLLASEKGRVLAQVKPTILNKLPIRDLDLVNNADEKALHDQIVRAVEQIMETKQKLSAAVNEKDVEFWTNKCDMLEKTIDQAVYKLYDLTHDEIKLIEQA